jgi:predicted transcriptional regulator
MCFEVPHLSSIRINRDAIVEHYLDHDAWFRQKVKTGLGQLDQQEFVTHEEIGARIDQLFRS